MASQIVYRPRHIKGYVHMGQIGVLLEVATNYGDTTFNLRKVKEFMRDMVLHIAASAPADLEDLLTQPFIKDQSKTVQDLVFEIKDYTKDRFDIIRFVRWDTEIEPPNEFDEPEPPHDPAIALKLSVVK